jgi:hypothetical protein
MSIVLVGSTSGSVTLQEPAVAGTTVLDLPATSGTVLTSASQSIPSAALPEGSVLQVVNATYSTAASTTSGTFQDTGLSATITPSSSSSKILVIWAVNGCYSTTGIGIETNLVRTSTQIVYTENIGARCSPPSGLPDTGSGTSGGTYLDSPATTSATTYKCQFRPRDGSSTVTVQFTGTGGASTSMMTLMEIAG